MSLRENNCRILVLMHIILKTIVFSPVILVHTVWRFGGNSYIRGYDSLELSVTQH